MQTRAGSKTKKLLNEQIFAKKNIANLIVQL